MGTPEFAATILRRIADAQGPPALVLTQPPREAGRGRKQSPSAVQTLCEQTGWHFDNPESVNTDASMKRLKDVTPDVILVAAFGQILKKPILELPKYCLNVHGSLLPKYRGAAPVQRAILDGDTETGITIQRMARKLDTGDILLQKRLLIRRKETSAQLLDRLAELGAESLIESVRMIESGKEKFIPQVEADATNAAKLDKKDSPIDWTRTAMEIERQVYGLQPWPVAETRLGKDRLQVYGADAMPGVPAVPGSTSAARAGSIVTDHKTHVHVVCGDGRVALTEIQLENRKRLSIVDFLKGYRGKFPFSHVGDADSKDSHGR